MVFVFAYLEKSLLSTVFYLGWWSLPANNSQVVALLTRLSPGYVQIFEAHALYKDEMTT